MQREGRLSTEREIFYHTHITLFNFIDVIEFYMNTKYIQHLFYNIKEQKIQKEYIIFTKKSIKIKYKNVRRWKSTRT